MRKFICTLCASLILVGASLAADTPKQKPPQPSAIVAAPEPEYVATRHTPELLERLGSYQQSPPPGAFPPTRADGCPVINGYPTFYCCTNVCYCYFMWADPCL